VSVIQEKYPGHSLCSHSLRNFDPSLGEKLSICAMFPGTESPRLKFRDNLSGKCRLSNTTCAYDHFKLPITTESVNDGRLRHPIKSQPSPDVGVRWRAARKHSTKIRCYGGCLVLNVNCYWVQV